MHVTILNGSKNPVFKVRWISDDIYSLHNSRVQKNAVVSQTWKFPKFYWIRKPYFWLFTFSFSFSFRHLNEIYGFKCTHCQALAPGFPRNCPDTSFLSPYPLPFFIWFFISVFLFISLLHSLSIYFVFFSQFPFLTFSIFLVSSNFQPFLSPSLRPYWPFPFPSSGPHHLQPHHHYHPFLRLLPRFLAFSILICNKAHAQEGLLSLCTLKKN